MIPSIIRLQNEEKAQVKSSGDVIERASWLSHPRTQVKLAFLKNKQYEYTRQAEFASLSPGNDETALIALRTAAALRIVIDTIEQ